MDNEVPIEYIRNLIIQKIGGNQRTIDYYTKHLKDQDFIEPITDGLFKINSTHKQDEEISKMERIRRLEEELRILKGGKK